MLPPGFRILPPLGLAVVSSHQSEAEINDLETAFGPNTSQKAYAVLFVNSGM
jgi:hypothetical protein